MREPEPVHAEHDPVAEELRLLEAFSPLERHMIVLVWDNAAHHTGLLVTYHGQYWVATCGHGIQQCVGRKMAILSGLRGGGLPGRHGDFGYFDRCIEDGDRVPDLGIIAVEPKDFLDVGHVFVDLAKEARAQWDGNKRHLIVGFPASLMKKTRSPDQRLNLSGTGITFMRPYLETEDEIRFTLLYRELGKPPQLPASPRGLSGSPVWEIADEATAENGPIPQ